MADTIKLYMFTGSTPSVTAQLMLEHKALEYRCVHVMVGPHAFAMLGRGFATMTVPALKIGDRRVQGSRQISRALDELVAEPPLFGDDPLVREAVQHAERRGEELQDVVRRIFWCAARRDPRAFMSVMPHAKAYMRPVQRVSRGLVTRLASAGHLATDAACEEDLAMLGARLEEIDEWIACGLLGGPQPNAADFQIAPSIACLLRFDDLAAHVERHPAAQLAGIAPPLPGRIGAVLPAVWLAPLHAHA